MRTGRFQTAIVILGFASSVSAQSSTPDASEAAARAALSVLAIAATPNETLSSLSLLSASGDDTSLRSTQLRGGTNPLDNGLFVEGLIAYQKYNPSLIFDDIAPSTELDVSWASVAATVGIGWDLPLGADWTIRPMGHFSLGHVTADATLVDLPLLPARSTAAEDAIDGSLNALGMGASLGIFRELEFGSWQAEYRFRQTFLQFDPINEPKAGNASANSNQTTVFSRHRYPLSDTNVLGHSANLVLDAGMVLYHGDAAKVLRTEWLVTAGIGLEIETKRLDLPNIRSGRIMLNGVLTEEFDGLSLGFGLNF